MERTAFDRIGEHTVRRTPEGYLRGSAVLTRTGVFVYRDTSGKTLRRWRPKEEVFAADSLETLKLLPITILHPTVTHDGLIDSRSAKKVSVGSTGETVSIDEDKYVSNTVVITSDEGVSATQSISGLSLGYTFVADATPGVTPEGEAYDEVQRNIRYNHLAIVPSGRAGKEAILRIAKDSDVELDNYNQQGREDMVKVSLDGIEYDTSPEVKNALDKALSVAKDSEEKVSKAVAEKEVAVAKADALALDCDNIRKQCTPEAIAEKVKEQLAFDSQVAAIKGKFPEISLDGKSKEYVQAFYDASQAAVSSAADQRKAVGKDGADGSSTDLAALKAAGLKKLENQWKVGK